MACFNPLVAYRGKSRNAVTGRTPMVFNSRDAADADDPVHLPCGQCIGCRLERSRQWAIRCVHEASLYEDNCFITLTYSPEFLPKSGSLVKKHFQDFMKRLRKRIASDLLKEPESREFLHHDSPRYFHCGEYGERFRRPHYHACLFNFNFRDRVLHSVRTGIKLDTSRLLSDLWPWGFSTVGDVTFESAAYVARYVTKKITGDSASSHYEVADSGTGEISSLLPEYVTMSRRPGIGRGWFEKYSSDVYPHDRVVLRGRECRPPRYYDSVFELANPQAFEDVKETRKQEGKMLAKDSSYSRLRVRERLQEIRLDLLKRSYEND